MISNLLISLTLTVAIEEGFALIWGLRGRRELGLVALASCLTNPPAALVYGITVGLWRWNPLPVTAAAELCAVLIEWRCYRAFSQKITRPFLFSLLANLTSYSLGLLLQGLL